MSFNLMDTAKSLFTSELVGKASSYLDESETGVAKAITGILPIVLIGLANKTATHEGAGTVAQMVNEQQQLGIAGNLSRFLNNDNNGYLNKAAGLLSGLFGDKVDGITGLISNFSGLRSSSASLLLSMAVPAVLALIGRHSTGGASGIAFLLSAQKNNIAAAIPSGLNLGNITGGFGRNVSDVTVKSDISHPITAETKESHTDILLPLFTMIAVTLAVWYLFGKNCNKTADIAGYEMDTMAVKTEQVTANVTNAVAAAGKVDSLTGDFIYDSGKNITIELPNGAGKLEVGENSTENKLYEFLSDPNAVIDTVKGNWFEFTNVKFKPNSSDITGASMTQLKNVVTIAKAYPTALFKLGGYTDNAGSAAGNIVLSQKRADAVVAMLKKIGISAAAIVEAKGYGSGWPLKDNGTEEGRAQNRRVAVSINSK